MRPSIDAVVRTRLVGPAQLGLAARDRRGELVAPQLGLVIVFAHHRGAVYPNVGGIYGICGLRRHKAGLSDHSPARAGNVHSTSIQFRIVCMTGLGLPSNANLASASWTA